jgi:virginiamycin B lyase
VKIIAYARRTGSVFGAAFLAVVMVVLVVVFSRVVAAESTHVPAVETASAEKRMLVQEIPAVAMDSDAASDGFVLRFDPVDNSFTQFALPTHGADPHSVVVISKATNLEVWFTERRADQIGRLVYTGTNEYAFHEYALPAGSEPLNLAHDSSFVWFTARKGNYIGRVQIATGNVKTFTGLTAESQPSGIDVAPDGSVWFTEMAADKIGRLVVTTTSNYKVSEYLIPQFPPLPTTSAPYGIVAEGNDRIWFAETVRNQLVRLQPSVYPFDPSGAFAQTGPPPKGGGVPWNLAYSTADGRLWFSELLGNRITLFNLSTLSMGLQYDVPTSNSRPYDLAADSGGRVWFSERSAGKLGSFVLTSTATFAEYPVPVADAKPQGVAVDPHGKIWLVASRYNAYLPLVAKDFPSPPSSFGVQTYWSVDSAHGLQEMVDADAQWLRLMIQWSQVEPADTTPANFKWLTYDTWFKNLYEAGILPVVTIQGNPEWAALHGGGPVYPEHMDDFLEFVGALVERYDGDGIADAPGSPVVNYWEFYNEQDNGSVLLAEYGYGYWGHNGAGYADLLRQAWPVVKAANPKARVLNGGIAYERFEETGEGPYVLQFLDDFLAAGGGDYIDIFNFHYYPDFANRWTRFGQGVIGKAAYLRNKLAEYGVTKPVVCTELGTHSDASRGGSDELQSRYVVQGFVRSMAADLDITIWFMLRDYVEGFPFFFGLLDVAYAPKPAYDAFSTLTNQLSGARYVRALTVGETGTTAVEGYVFELRGQVIYVAWTNDGWAHTMTITASKVEQVDKYGVSKAITDSADGVADSKIAVDVRPSPAYFRIEP